jgi:mono/diheme cytochrome c family protein
VNLRKSFTLLVMVAAAALVAACGNLQEQPKLHKPFDASPNFDTAARMPLPEAVPVGALNEDEHFYTGMVDGEFVDTFPFEITADVIAEGRAEFEAYCTPCHGNAGYGDGILSQEGFPPPASLHDPEISEKPIGNYFDVITNGQNAMYSYASRVTAEERWAVIAYIRVLQRSQNVQLSELPADLQTQFE